MLTAAVAQACQLVTYCDISGTMAEIAKALVMGVGRGQFTPAHIVRGEFVPEPITEGRGLFAPAPVVGDVVYPSNTTH